MFYTKFKTNKFRLVDHDDYRWCNLLGVWVENGEYPNDSEALKAIVRSICHDNAKEYFGI